MEAIEDPPRVKEGHTLGDLVGTDEWKPPVWIDDEKQKECASCVKGFSLFRRRHHCRACGRVFCDDCTLKRYPLPVKEGAPLTKERVCNSCFLQLVEADIARNPSAHPPKPDFVTLHKELVEKLKPFVAMPESEWTPGASGPGVTIHTRKLDDSAIVCVRSKVTVVAPLDKVLLVYNNSTLWKNWQPDMHECRAIEKVNDLSEVLYVLYKLPLIDDRDLVFYSARMPGLIDRDAPDCSTLLSASIIHPLCPRVKGVVRAHINMGATSFIPYEKDGKIHTDIIMVMHSDPKGLIPPFVINQVLTKAVDQARDMAKFIENYSP